MRVLTYIFFDNNTNYCAEDFLSVRESLYIWDHVGGYDPPREFFWDNKKMPCCDNSLADRQGVPQTPYIATVWVDKNCKLAQHSPPDYNNVLSMWSLFIYIYVSLKLFFIFFLLSTLKIKKWNICMMLLYSLIRSSSLVLVSQVSSWSQFLFVIIIVMSQEHIVLTSSSSSYHGRSTTGTESESLQKEPRQNLHGVGQAKR